LSSCFRFKRHHCSCFVVGFRLPLDLCLCGCLFLGEAVANRVSKRFADGSFFRGWLRSWVFLWWLLGVIPCGDRLGFRVYIRCHLLLFVFRVLWGWVSFELSSFLFLIWLTFCTIINYANCLTFCVLDAGGPIILLRDRELVSFCNLVLIGFGVPLVERVWGGLLIWSWSLADRSLLIRDRESVI